MLQYLKRLITTGAAYQFGDLVSKGAALVTLPLYSRHVSETGYGAANSLLTAVILFSIMLRLGVGEAFIRFYFDDEDPVRRDRIGRTATATVAWTTTIAALVGFVFSGTLARLLLGSGDAVLIDCAIVGLWAFTNLEVAYAQLRVDELKRTYILASGSNVVMTVTFTITLVVVAGQGARGLLLGNFAASGLIVLALWWTRRRRFSLHVRVADLHAMLRFGLPTIPADASLYALQVVDRFYLFRLYGHAAAGVYAVSVQLATVVFVAVRGFQYAWPPLAYSITSDTEAARLYSLVTTYYALSTGFVVCAVTLLGRWMVMLLAAHKFLAAYKALPWLALGWALYGLYLVFIVIAGRKRVTSRNLLAAVAGLAVNIALLNILVPDKRAGLGIAGAGVALCSAYTVMLVVMYFLTRGLFRVKFDWPRLARLGIILVGVAISGDLLLPNDGLEGLVERVAWLAWIPVLLLLTRFFPPHERGQIRALLAEGRRRAMSFRAARDGIAAYGENSLRDSDDL